VGVGDGGVGVRVGADEFTVEVGADDAAAADHQVVVVFPVIEGTGGLLGGDDSGGDVDGLAGGERGVGVLVVVAVLVGAGFEDLLAVCEPLDPDAVDVDLVEALVGGGVFTWRWWVKRAARGRLDVMVFFSIFTHMETE